MSSNLSVVHARHRDLYVQHSYVFAFEKSFNATSVHYSFLCDKFHSYIYFVLGAYLLATFVLKRFMSNREPFKLTLPLILWNATLATFSIIGSFRTLKELLAVYRAEGLDGTLCHDGNRFSVTGLWTFLFVFSKIPEMVDTLFLVLRKRPLIFLHWYHHLETCVYSIWTYTAPCIGVSRWFVTLNYCVHSLMYTYYGLSAAGIKLPKAIAMVITTAQTSQMFVGLYVVIRALYLDCGNYKPALYGGLFTYTAYAGLFTNYLIGSYFRKGRGEKKKKP